MKHIILIALITLLLGGCTGVSTNPAGEAYAQDELYQGYPCSPNCEEFKKGFDSAGEQELTDPNMCQGESLAEVTGCKAYVNEYQIEHKTYQQLLEDL